MKDSQISAFLSEIETVYKQIDQIINHLKVQIRLSHKDLEFLREVIFHIDGLLNKLKFQEEDEQLDLYKNDLIDYLNQANQHLRKFLLENESTALEHHPDHQEKNNQLFISLINQLKRMK